MSDREPVQPQHAIHAIAGAIRAHTAIQARQAKHETLRNRQNHRTQARIQWAAKVQEGGNLVLASMVLAQVLDVSIQAELALDGLGLFVGAYLFAYGVMRGGEHP